MKNYILLILAVIIAASCTRKSTTSINKESIRVDTFFRYREVTRTVPQKDSIVIFNPCDSTGIINHFYAQISIPNGKVNIQSKGNHIVASVVANESVSVNDSASTKQIRQSTSVVEKIIIKDVIPSWIIIALFIETLIILLYLYFKFIYPR